MFIYTYSYKDPIRYIFQILLIVTIMTTIVFSVCWINLGSGFLNTFAINLPYLFLILYDVVLIYRYKLIIFKRLLGGLKKNKSYFAPLMIYLIYEFFNMANGIKWGEIDYIGNKILIICKFIFLFVNVILFIEEDEKKIKNKEILFFIGITSFIISAFAIAVYVIMPEPLYMSRISPYKDYNVFATTLLFVTIVLVSNIIKTERYREITKIIIMMVTIAFNYSIVVLSGSRRGIVLAGISLIGLMIAFFLQKQKTSIKSIIRSLIECIIILMVSILIIGCIYYGFNKYIEIKANALSIDVHETSLADRYESINTEEGLSSRGPLWEIAGVEIRNMNLKELVFGCGSGYNMVIYEKPENESQLSKNDGHEEAKWDPHNIVLNDILEGGIIKVALLLVLMVSVIYTIIRRVIKNDIVNALMMFNLGTILLAKTFLSARRGILGEDIFWLMMMVLYIVTEERRKNFHRLKSRP